MVPPSDPASLAGALSRLVGDGKLRQQLGLEARRCYEAHFRFERMAEETLAVYNRFAHRIT